MRRVTTYATYLLWALAVACAGEETQNASGTNGAGAGSSGPGATSGAMSSSMVSASINSSSSGMPYNCDPPADPGSIYELNDTAFGTFAPVSMCEYRGQVVLIVNIAAL